MQLNQHQQWLINFYQQRDWYKLSPFIRLNFISEEVGELSRAVRAIEIGRDHPGEKKQTPSQLTDNLMEEMADTLDQVIVLSSLYGIKAEDLIKYSEQKLKRRFENELQ
ncbi:MazG nucleotide pyrophosphohydrolase domain-containing protein [Paucilactobacillus wasatchensis]|uniref:Putative pyrophosphatase n=1 Tax=Paucilactobacillus wasatchensis TaxID=1335616 RepID=A0A0D0Y6C8_9LACO|nr:MazG nucleotide pyrophosphohydrolase domain-containing protein [Paucilactobacillus wasatchensis]KIS03828.1 putative pyrophosphatase [Paucilactobacillus wasatchensis]